MSEIEQPEECIECQAQEFLSLWREHMGWIALQPEQRMTSFLSPAQIMTDMMREILDQKEEKVQYAQHQPDDGALSTNSDGAICQLECGIFNGETRKDDVEPGAKEEG